MRQVDSVGARTELIHPAAKTICVKDAVVFISRITLRNVCHGQAVYFDDIIARTTGHVHAGFVRIDRDRVPIIRQDVIFNAINGCQFTRLVRAVSGNRNRIAVTSIVVAQNCRTAIIVLIQRNNDVGPIVQVHGRRVRNIKLIEGQDIPGICAREIKLTAAIHVDDIDPVEDTRNQRTGLRGVKDDGINTISTRHILIARAKCHG